MATSEIAEMASMLEAAGYHGRDAERLAAEGMGTYYLGYVLAFEPGSLGSLAYTHGLSYRESAVTCACGKPRFYPSGWCGECS